MNCSGSSVFKDLIPINDLIICNVLIDLSEHVWHFPERRRYFTAA